MFELDDDCDDEPDVLFFNHQQAARDLMTIYRQDVANGDSCSTDEFIGILELELNKIATLEEKMVRQDSQIRNFKRFVQLTEKHGAKGRVIEAFGAYVHSSDICELEASFSPVASTNSQPNGQRDSCR